MVRIGIQCQCLPEPQCDSLFPHPKRPSWFVGGFGKALATSVMVEGAWTSSHNNSDECLLVLGRRLDGCFVGNLRANAGSADDRATTQSFGMGVDSIYD
jgi:hypothetical protein